MSKPLRIAALASVLLHLLLGAGVLLFGQREVPTAPSSAEDADAPAQVELLPMEQAGSGETVAAAQEAAQIETQTAAATPPLGEADAPPIPPPVPPAPPAAARPTLRFNLGGTDSEANATVLGDHVIPASVDDRARNRPPAYPTEAARRRQQGSVVVMIHVSPEGLAMGADVVQSSGFPALDRAARDAVLAWRFLPAVRDGAPVAFDMPMRFVFDAN